MTQTVFEKMKTAISVLKLDFTTEEFATFADDQELSEEAIEAVQTVFSYISEKKQQTTVQTLLKLSRLPKKAPKKARTTQCVTVAVVRSDRGYLLEKRPESGLLAGLWQPYAVCGDHFLSQDELLCRLDEIGVQATYTAPLPDARHLFTHVEWNLRGYAFVAPYTVLPENCVWAADCTAYAIPSAYRVYRDYLYGKAIL